MSATARSLSSDEFEVIDSDEHLPFGHFAPNVMQRALIAVAANSVLRRGVFRDVMASLVMGASREPLDIVFRGCAYRLRGRNNTTQFGILLNPDYNAADIDFLLDGMTPGGVFIDIGANIGLYTLPLARKAGLEGRVVAIDANRLMARRLAWNAAASGLDRCIAIFACAVSDRDGTGSLSIRKNNMGSVALEDDVPGSVPIRTLPSILAEAGVEHIDGLKIDVEGHEDRVLAPFIRACDVVLLPGRIVMERSPGNEDYPACAAALAERGYRLVGRSRSNSFYARG